MSVLGFAGIVLADWVLTDGNESMNHHQGDLSKVCNDDPMRISMQTGVAAIPEGKSEPEGKSDSRRAPSAHGLAGDA
jgi:hypothetical protein